MRFRVIFHTFLGDFRQDFLLFCIWPTMRNSRPWLHNNTKVATWPKKQSKCQKPWKRGLFRKKYRMKGHRKSHCYRHLKNEKKIKLVKKWTNWIFLAWKFNFLKSQIVSKNSIFQKTQNHSKWLKMTQNDIN